MEWSPTVAYCVGLITTDGCLASDKRHIDFTSKDRELVEYVQACLGPQNQICMKGRGRGPERYFRIQLSNVRLDQWLCALGLTPRKSLTLGALDIPDAVFADFLRGCLDGDGSLIVYWDPIFPNSLHCYVRFNSASRPHVDWLQATVTRLVALKGYQTNATPRLRRLSYAKRDSLKLLKYLYYSDDLPCLRRKRRIMEQFLTDQAGVVKLANTRVSEARAERLGGSTPPLRTISFPTSEVSVAESMVLK